MLSGKMIVLVLNNGGPLIKEIGVMHVEDCDVQLKNKFATRDWHL